MATYVVGDVQGCYDELLALLDAVRFSPESDALCLAGDLVNRGPKSLEVLRFARELGRSCSAVLGNHDLHLLACALIERLSPRKRDTFRDVLEAPDADELFEWLLQQPLVIDYPAFNFLVVHAGLLPGWTTAFALERAQEVESILRGPDRDKFLDVMYGDQPDRWSPALKEMDRLRVITNVLTRLRYCSLDGRIDLDAKGAPGTVGTNLVPWFETRGARKADERRIAFGHWSTLSLSAEERQHWGVFPLDTGAVWGGALTALRLEDAQMFAVASRTTVPLS